MASNEHVYEHSTGSEMVDDDIQIQSGMEDMSIEDLTSRLNLFKKPQQLIKTEKGGQLEVDTNVLSQLSQVNMKISVVCVCGSYRTGKSYLMNRIAGDKTGFKLGDTIRSETKGIWIRCRPHPTQRGQVLVLLDTEGFGDPGKGDLEHDSKTFCLALLMSSILIINVKSVFDFQTLMDLNFIINLPETIKVLDDKAEDKHNAKTIQVAVPTLIMCLRDSYLEIMIDGRLQTADEYLEDSLKSVNLSTLTSKEQVQKQEESNKVKEGIKDFFPERKCFAIAQPAMGRKLKNIEQLDETSLDESFVENIKTLQEYVYMREPKKICNASTKPLEGPGLTNGRPCGGGRDGRSSIATSHPPTPTNEFDLSQSSVADDAGHMYPTRSSNQSSLVPRLQPDATQQKTSTADRTSISSQSFQ
ncbi:guanylate-binding protein 4-like [Ruditapes philippinarum]|uniref:guanylate-binding protein 4-like n=1 Tax=Ruditapes philippinarum TaxID=129788 RepID=UPI00295A9CB1|nr:guanylate-binding protein 4-like [Ruditapes philippinarum]